MDTFKILTTVFFEIRDADFFGGKDTVGYSKMVAELDVTESKPDLFDRCTEHKRERTSRCTEQIISVTDG